MDHAPAGSPSILVSDRLTVASDHAATANPNVYFVGTNVVSHIAGDVAAVWTDLLAASAQQEPVHGSAARSGDSFGQAAWLAGVVMIASNSIGVNRPRPAWRRRRW